MLIGRRNINEYMHVGSFYCYVLFSSISSFLDGNLFKCWLKMSNNYLDDFTNELFSGDCAQVNSYVVPYMTYRDEHLTFNKPFDHFNGDLVNV